MPGETILIAAAVHAGAGRLSMVGVGLIAFLAVVIGDNLGYAIGHFGGRALVLRYGRYVMLTSERLDKAEGSGESGGCGGAALISSITKDYSAACWPEALS